MYTDNLSKDFSSFDVLWFDLSTKVRSMMDELTQPIYHMAYEQEGKIKQIEKTNSDQQTKLDEIDKVVYNKQDEVAELDIFKEIFAKISQVEADRKVVEARLESNVESVLKTFKEYGFKFEQNEKVFKQLTVNVENVVDEISKLKDKTAADHKLFISTLSETQDRLNKEMKVIIEENTRLGKRQDKLDMELKHQDSVIKETLNRMDRSEDRIFDVEAETRRLD